MTRKDYVAIAAAIKSAMETPNAGVPTVAIYLAAMMAQENSRFDRARFLKDCGVSA